MTAPTTAPPEGRTGARPTAPSRFLVLPAKVAGSVRRPTDITRGRVVAAGLEASTPIVAFIAPAGYGKSSAVRDIAAAAGRPIAWLEADARDRDPATLLLGLAAAVDPVVSLDDEVVAAVTAPGSTIWTRAVPLLVGAVAAGSPLTIVIDETEHIDAPESIAILLAFVDALPAGSRLLLAGRTATALPYSRLVASGTLTILDRSVLAFDGAEADALVRSIGAAIPSADRERLVARSEGWPLGLSMAVHAHLAGGPDRVAAPPTAPARQLEHYLRTEILARLSPSDADLLLGGSVLDRLSGPLCDAALERSGSAVDLDRLEREDQLILPIDEGRTTFRLHPLLREVLQAELGRRDPAAPARILGRAAAWLEVGRSLEEALETALRAGDEDRAARLAMMLAQGAINAGRFETVQRWFAWFDDRDTADRIPRFAVVAALMFGIQGDYAHAARWMAVAERVRPIAGDDRAFAEPFATMRVMLAPDGLEALIADGRKARAMTTSDSTWHVAATAAEGIGPWLAGDPDAAEGSLVAAVAAWEAGHVGPSSAVLALTVLASIARARGDRAGAEARVETARRALTTNGLLDTSIAVPIAALAARIAAGRGLLAQAAKDVAHAQRLRPSLGLSMPWLSIRARIDASHAALALGDVAGARVLLDEVRDLLAVRPDMGILVADAADLERRLATAGRGEPGPTSLTMAELRLLPYLTTHLTFEEIGERLAVSRNTIKTQAISIYRKLDATSRGEAVERGVALGLLESTGPSHPITRPG